MCICEKWKNDLPTERGTHMTYTSTAKTYQQDVSGAIDAPYIGHADYAFDGERSSSID